MPRDIIKVGKQGVRIGDRVVTVKKKGIVYLLIDLSDSMNMFVGTKEELSLLKGTPQVSKDGFTGIRVDKSEHTSRLKTKLDVALAGMKGFVDRALATKMVGIILFGSSAVLHHTASYDQAPSAPSHFRRGAAPAERRGHQSVGRATDPDQDGGHRNRGSCHRREAGQPGEGIGDGESPEGERNGDPGHRY